jgi:ABC-2 type transport system permease protein
VIGRPGSILWLLGHELRLNWRGLVGRRGGVWRLGVFAVIGVFLLIGGGFAAVAIGDWQAPVNRLTILAADTVSLLVFSLMLSQSLAGAVDALYARGDLDLLFSSPLDPRKTLTVRFASLAASAFASFALLVTPFLIPFALFGHWRWLALLPVLASLALAASACGLALAVGLFRLIGPRRTRAVAQILAAIIGAAFFLASQLRTFLGARSDGLIAQVGRAAADPRLGLPPLADWPLRAALGEPLPLMALVALGVGLFLVVTAWLSRRFADDATSAQGVSAGGPTGAGRSIGSFAGSVFAATFLKEVRLLRRDIALLAQVLLRVLYLLPATFVVLRNADCHVSLALPGGAAVIAFLAGQVAGSLAWITISAEEVPELIAASPAKAATVRNAKLLAALTPLIVLLAVPLAVLTWMTPIAGLAASAGAAASATAAGLISAWYPVPGKRSEFRRRRRGGGSVLVSIALVVISLLIAGATGLAALASPFFVIPALLAGLGLFALRRSPARIAEALASA